MARILIGAQNFGLGPASKAETIARELSGTHAIDFVGDGDAHRFALDENLYARVFTRSALARIDLSSYQAIVSVMEPHTALAGYHAQIPTIAVDSLFGFWTWDAPETYEPHVETMRRLTLSDAIALLDSFENQAQQWFTHRLSDRSYVQSDPLREQHDDPDRGLRAIHTVGPIISAARRGVNGSRILVNTCGLTSPVVDRAQAHRYVALIDRMIEPLIEAFPDHTFEHVGNALDTIPKRFWSHRGWLPKHEYLARLASSKALLIPASLTSYNEARASGVPVFILPEQHDGHRPNYDAIGPLPHALLSERYPELTRVEESGVTAIHDRIATILDEPDGYLESATARIRAFIEHPPAPARAEAPARIGAEIERLIR